MPHSPTHSGPTLRRRLIVQLCILNLGSVALAVAAVVGLGRMHEDHGLAIRGYQQIREACEVGFHLAQAQSALRTPALGPWRSQRDAETALFNLRDAKGWLDSTASINAALHRDVVDAAAHLRAGDSLAAESSLRQATARLAEMLASVRTAPSALRPAFDTAAAALSPRPGVRRTAPTGLAKRGCADRWGASRALHRT